jgi:hypothetical protein
VAVILIFPTAWGLLSILFWSMVDWQATTCSNVGFRKRSQQASKMRSSKVVVLVLKDLRNLSKEALAANKSLLLWVCL